MVTGPLAVGRVEHPRPGVIRGLDCVLPAAEGRPAIAVPLVEVESSADEDRIRIGRFACDATAAAVLATLGREWLADEVRFRRTCLIEVADFSWAGVSPPSDPSASPATTLRVECGARPGPAAAPLPPGGDRGFDAAACIVGVGPHGVQVLPTTRLPAGLATSRGDVLLLPPAAPVPGDRIAWMLSAPGTTYGPAIGPGSWLISVLPGPSPQSSDSGRQF
jgi:hypothetical protein